MKRPFALTIAALTAVLFLSGSALAQDHAAPKPADPPKSAEPTKKDEPKKDDKPATPTTTTPPKTENKTLPDFEYVKMVTSQGNIVIKLNRGKAPISVENFLKYVDKKFYDGTIFHRVIKDFMIQCGGFTADMKEKATDPPIKNEWKNGLKNKKYTVAMARTQVADSATSQFYINTADNAFLDQDRGDGAAYAVFGEVVAGQDTVDKIGSAKTGNKGRMGDVPVETITITSITKITEDDAKKAGMK